MLSHLLERCRFPDADHVVCAVSGGPDSLALLVLAVEAGKQVTAVHVDHGLRTDSANDADVVIDAARRFGAEVIIEKVTVEPGSNLEARARKARYAVLPSGVLLGHTADDQAETMLLNLLRGTGMGGLTGMAHTNRPILDLRRHETHELCRAVGLTPVVDGTNSDPQWRRNRVRHEVLPLLDEVSERDVVPLFVRLAELLSDDNALLDDLAEQLDVSNALALAGAPLPLARRAIRNWLRVQTDAEQHPPSLAAIDRVIEVARGTQRATEIEGGLTVKRTSQRLYVVGKK